jgi:hypothetical protein
MFHLLRRWRPASGEYSVMDLGCLVGLKADDISAIFVEIISVAPSEAGLSLEIHANRNPVKLHPYAGAGGPKKDEPGEVFVDSIGIRALAAECPDRAPGCVKLLRLMDAQADVPGCEVMSFDSDPHEPCFCLRFIMIGHCG